MHFARNGPEFYGAPYAPGVGGGGGAGGAATQTRSALLEEFRSRHSKNRKFELADIYGSVVEFSGDQHGSRFIQEKLDSASAEEKKTLFDEVLPHARQLMTDVFGNYVIQKMLEHGDDEQRAVLAREMEGNVLSLSLGTYGCGWCRRLSTTLRPSSARSWPRSSMATLCSACATRTRTTWCRR